MSVLCTIKNTHVKMTQNQVSRPQEWDGAVVRTPLAIGIMHCVGAGQKVALRNERIG